MKKPYMRTITGSSGRDCILIILFQIYGSKAGLFEGNLFWVGQYAPPPPNLYIGRRTTHFNTYKHQHIEILYIYYNWALV